jgi:nucleotide-binding universal stress UspA family protein
MRSQSFGARPRARAVLPRESRRAEEQGVEVEWGARQGDPAEALLEAAAEMDADVIVVASKGMTGVKRLEMGSVANKVTHHAPCSVMVVRTD